MAKKSAKTTNSEITVTLGSEAGGLPISTFFTTISNMIGLLKNIATQEYPGAKIEWEIVRVSMGSPMAMTFAPTGSPSPVVAKRVLRNYIYALRAIEPGSKSKYHFTGQDLITARTMIGVLNDRINVLNFEVPEIGIAQPTKSSIIDIDENIRGATRYEYTTIQGRLEDIATHAGDYKFTIFDTITDLPVSCKFSDRDLSKVGEALRKRVRVTGNACFVRDTATTIDVEELQVLDARSINFLDLPPIDITGGMDAADYVRAVRNGE